MLSEHYPNPGVPLDHKDPYTLFACYALCKTTDKRSMRLHPDYLLWQTTQRYGAAILRAIKERIKYIGLSNNKAKNLKLSAIIHEKHNGIVPDNMRIRGPGLDTKQQVSSCHKLWTSHCGHISIVLHIDGVYPMVKMSFKRERSKDSFQRTME